MRYLALDDTRHPACTAAAECSALGSFDEVDLHVAQVHAAGKVAECLVQIIA